MLPLTGALSIKSAILLILKTFSSLAYIKDIILSKTDTCEAIEHFIKEALAQDESTMIIETLIEYLQEENQNDSTYKQFLKKFKAIESQFALEASHKVSSTAEETEDGRCSSPLHMCLLQLDSCCEPSCFDIPIKHFTCVCEAISEDLVQDDSTIEYPQEENQCKQFLKKFKAIESQSALEASQLFQYPINSTKESDFQYSL